MALLDAPLDAELEDIPGAPYSYNGSLAEESVGDLIDILRKRLTSAVLRESIVPLQQIEDALWALLACLTDIDGAGGVHLDRIGKWLDLGRRDGWNDPTYRRRLRARILQLRSQGRIEDLLGIAALLLDLTGPGWLELLEHNGPACMDLYVHTVPDAVEVEDLRVILGSAKAGGVSLQVLVAQDVDEDLGALIAGDEGGDVDGGFAGDDGGDVEGDGMAGSVFRAP